MKTIKDVVKLFNKRIAKNFIPDTKDEFRDLIKRTLRGSTEMSAQDISKQLALNSLAQRDIDWIISEGKCLDNLVKKKSTIPHAGMGAFAQRFIPKGETVIIAPLLHIMEADESTLIYPLEFDEEEGEIVIKGNDPDPEGIQLIVNYCFSHDKSSMLLCPQTNAILINHCSERHDYGGDCAKNNKNDDGALRGPNAEIRWATEWDPDTEEWLKLSFKELRKYVSKGTRGLSFEVIAKRDIYPGDEVRFLLLVLNMRNYYLFK